MVVCSEEAYARVIGVMNISGLISLVINIYLLPVIYYGSGKEIGSYRYLLFLYTSVSAVFSVVNFFDTPMFAVDEKGWVLYAATLDVPQTLGSWTVVVYCGCYMSLLLTLTFSYIYRYVVMCRPKLISWFRTPAKLFVIALICAVCLSIWTGVTAVLLRASESTNVKFHNLIFQASGRQAESLSYIAMDSYKNGRPLASFLAIVFMRIGFIGTAGAVIGYCTAKVIKEFRQKASVTSNRSRTNKMQSRLFILLISQTLVPLLFSLAPALLSYLMALFAVHAPKVSFYSSTLLPVSQIVDPLLIMLFVSDYRRAPITFFNHLNSIHQGRCAVSSLP